MFDESDPFAPIPDNNNKQNISNNNEILDQPIDNDQNDEPNRHTQQHQSPTSNRNFSQRHHLDDDDVSLKSHKE